ncbi:hypothetical protein M407DRAFT_204520 [Tulasnella calospora MUT 4182]|uniref:Uncharacterized protein n=1 Tax=Tulasnella calospora MUT 4182 TaxID=1051891 RepID=A0A0C3QUK1_9AGAM|nr:hypothetical protein M407DRAFT_204520 [Tulasnella calospora MUT 4182]
MSSDPNRSSTPTRVERQDGDADTKLRVVRALSSCDAQAKEQGEFVASIMPIDTPNSLLWFRRPSASLHCFTLSSPIRLGAQWW